MQTMYLIWCLRALAGLAIGFFIARKLRDFIRSIVIMCIPLKHRISERSFQIQTRLTTLVSILLMILIAVGLNWGLSKGLAQIGVFETTTIHSNNTTPAIRLPISTPKPNPIPKTTINAQSETPPTVIQQPVNTREVPTIPTTNKELISTTIQNQLPTPPVRTHPQAYTAPTYAPEVSQYLMYYYAQIYAFRDFGKAQTQQLKWHNHSQLPIKIGFIQWEQAPYKVLIGPFRNAHAANSFLRQHQIKGFVRPAHQLQIFE